MKTLITILVVVVAILVGIGLVRGWFNYRQTEDKATIEIKTDEIKKDATKAKETGDQLIEKAGDALENDAEEQTDDSVDETADPTTSKERTPLP